MEQTNTEETFSKASDKFFTEKTKLDNLIESSPLSSSQKKELELQLNVVLESLLEYYASHIKMTNQQKLAVDYVSKYLIG